MKIFNTVLTNLTLVATVCTLVMSSCDIDDLNPSSGTSENYTIDDKNYGTLEVNEKYAAYEAAFDIDKNPYGIKRIEFSAIGTYYITFDDSNDGYKTKFDGQKEITVEIDGKKAQIPLKFGANKGEEGDKSSGTYTYKNGEYVIMDNYDWKISGNTVEITENGKTTTYKAEKVTYAKIDALTKRLCHTWNLNRVLVKAYKDGKLVVTYHLTDEQVKQYCVDEFYFGKPETKNAKGSFHRYKDGMQNGVGLWQWKVLEEQNLAYEFTHMSDNDLTPVVGANDLTVYFSKNRLYITEEAGKDLEGNIYDTDGNLLDVKAVFLYQLDVKGN